VDQGRWLKAWGRVAYEPLVLDSYSSARRPRSLRKAEKSVWGWLKGAAGTVYALACHIGCELVKGVLHGLGDLAGKVGGYLVKGVKSGLEHVGHVFGIGSPSKWAALHIGKPLAAGIRGGSSKASAVSAAGRCADQERADAGLFVGQGSYPGGGTIAVEARDTGDQPRRLGRHTSPDRRSTTSRSTVPATRTPSPTGYSRGCRSAAQPGTVQARPVRRTRVGLG
jgi:hypothetical protein